MFKLYLRGRDPTQYPIKKYTKFDFIKRRYLSELLTVKEYYRNKDRAVNNNHLLSRLIKMISPDVYMDIFDYNNIVTSVSESVSKQFNIVSNIHSGEVLDNIFFGINSKEILLYADSNIDPFDIKDTWKEYSSVKVIYTQETDLDFNIPFNNKEYLLPTLHIMTVDINLMLLQYKYWSMDRLNNDTSNDVNVFISQIVLPNMLDNILDFAIYNRFIAITQNIEIPSFTTTHPFHILDYSKGIDSVLKKVAKDMHNSNIDYVQLYETIPTIANTSVMEMLHIDHTYYNKQSEWVLMLARIPTISETIDVLGKQGIKHNRSILYKLKFKLKSLSRDRTLKDKIFKLDYLQMSMDLYLDNIKQAIKG